MSTLLCDSFPGLFKVGNNFDRKAAERERKRPEKRFLLAFAHGLTPPMIKQSIM